MRRYTSLLLTAFILLIVVLAGSAYLAGAGQENVEQPQHTIRVYTTLPAETASILADGYASNHDTHIDFVSLSSDEIIRHLQEQVKSGKDDGEAAMILADSRTLERAAALGYLVPYISEAGDQVAPNFRQESGYWVGVFYDPIVFCVNSDYLRMQSDMPDTWTALAKRSKARIGITDFLAADASANLFCSMVAQFGDAATYDIWRDLHPRVVQYARYLSNPVRQAGMGEVDIAIAVESEALRYIHDGYPLRIVYPADGTAAIITGTGIAYRAKPSDKEQAQQFADWLLTDEAQLVLQVKDQFLVPTNPATMAYMSFAGKNIVLFDQPEAVNFSQQQRHDLLDRWVKEIRFQST